VRRAGLRRALIVLLLVWPWLVSEQPWSNIAVQASIMVLALLSLVVLTGWVGQISLAQAGIMGVGAFSAARLANHVGLDFPFHIPLAGLASAATAVLIGLPALRIRGLYLAIATLAFQWMLQASLLQAHWFSGGFNGIKIAPPRIATYDLSSERLLYYAVWPVTILVIMLVINLRDSKTGRAWFAVRGSEVAAKTLGINVTRYKLLAFACSGFILGVAGSIKLNLVGSATPLEYFFDRSILFLAVAVLGGIGAVAGAVGIGIFFVFLNEYLFGKLPTEWADIVPILAGLLLIVTILQNPGGMAAAREHLREQRLMRKARRQARTARGLEATLAPAEGALATAIADSPAEGAAPTRATGSSELATSLARRLEERGARRERAESPALLRAEDVTVRFGGVTANDAIHLEVRHGEITGLIGPNGAGKTTLFNTVNGLVRPTSGSILLAGADMTEMATHARAGLGMARTFQIMRLFPRLTVFDNVMIGTHLQNVSGFASNVLMLGRSRGEDARLRDRVHETLAFLGIEQFAQERVAGLPFGILRLVELARALVGSPKLLLLDEPASGLDIAETDVLAEHLMRIRDDMGHTILLIEHDMRLVMMVSDYVYVLDFGRNLAEGVPDVVQRDPQVIAAYLGEEVHIA
jgi:ABC-type branched-subunit amino acid transport system ATPase component/ABC-type branched-subunit amino acid transport system permease subunit